jgi:hypothetical protein
MFQPDRRMPLLATGPEHHVEGELGDCLIVSVPPTTSHESCRQLREKLRQAVGSPDKPVLILTHNIEFLRAHRLGTSEASKVARRIDESVYANAEPKPSPRPDGGAAKTSA